MTTKMWALSKKACPLLAVVFSNYFLKNWTAHIRWTGPQIWQQLPEINILCMSMGTAGQSAICCCHVLISQKLSIRHAGCITGTGMYLKSQKPSVAVLG